MRHDEKKLIQWDLYMPCRVMALTLKFPFHLLWLIPPIVPSAALPPSLHHAAHKDINYLARHILTFSPHLAHTNLLAISAMLLSICPPLLPHPYALQLCLPSGLLTFIYCGVPHKLLNYGMYGQWIVFSPPSSPPLH